MSKLSLALPLLLLPTIAMPLAAEAPGPVFPDLTIAFLGDQGLGSDAEEVLALIRDEGADAVIHMGDFDYHGDPAAWDAQIDAVLGPDFPYFASAGNHDESEFYGPGGYQERLEARLNRLGIPWEGDLGVLSSLHFGNVFIVLTAPGSYGDGDEVHAPYIRDALAADDSVWSVSAWHKNMRQMQVGGKSDETGWGVYEESRRGGAIIATAHEHSYSRTHLMADFETQEIAGTEPPLEIAADDPATPEDEGRSFAFVSGLGGHSIRDQEIDGPWWASVYTSDQGAQFGALFGVFNYGGDPNLARFTFKDVTGRVVDDFFVTSSLAPAPPALRIDDAAVVEGDSGTSDALLLVTLVGASGDEVSVDYATLDGSAVAGEDYDPASGHLVFSGEVVQQSVGVPIRGDASEEGEESLFVELFAADGAIVTRPRGELVILDDDAPPAPLRLEVDAQGPGLVTLDPPGGLYASGTQVELTAVPAPGNRFAGWDGDLAGAANPATLQMDADRQVVARFVATEAELLEVESGGAGSAGSVATAAPLDPVDGQLYVAAISFKPDVAVSAVSGLGLAWSPVRAQCSGRGQTGVAVWQAQGTPTAGGVVTATFAGAPESSAIVVSRYAGVGAIDPEGGVSGNSVGVDGACSGGSDGAAYALDLGAVAAGSLVYVAAAPRNRDHLPGPAFTERAELFAGGGGSIAGLSVADARADAAGPFPVAGSFDGDVDWAVVALELPVEVPYLLTVEPTPGGSIAVDPPYGVYAAGSAVALTASPDPGHRFGGWSGDLAGAPNPATLAMDSDKTVGADFVPQFHVDLLTGSGGSVALDPPGGLYDAGTAVALTAVAAPRHRFAGWSGALSGLANPATLVVDSDEVVTAAFVSLFDLDVTSGPGGSVSVDPPSGPYEDGSSVTLTALPEPTHRFGGWSGALAGTINPATLVIEADEVVAATFVPQATLAVAPAVGGSVALDPPGGVYDVGTPVTVTALPDPLFRFDGWSAALTGSGNPATLVVDADATVGASFFPQAALDVRQTFGGSVALDPPGGIYDLGATVTLTATPWEGRIFSGWYGGLVGTASPLSVVLDRNLRVAARFPVPVSLEQIDGGSSANASSVSTDGAVAAASGDLYLAAIAFKPHVSVTGVSGLGLDWSPVREQCAGRGQTGVAVWQARGEPAADGVVTATLSAGVQNAVVAVSRYADADAIDVAASVSANSVGPAGACEGGEDQDAYALELDATHPGGLLYVATAMRHRDHLPGDGYDERVELHRGSGGSVAGIALAEGASDSPGPTAVEGSFDGTVDWAAIALEIPVSWGPRTMPRRVAR